MGNYSKDRLSLIAQGLAGGAKIWHYTDTGLGSNIAESAGFITDGHDMGCDTGDLVFMKATDNARNNTVTSTAFVSVTDTGNSATLGAITLVGDTS